MGDLQDGFRNLVNQEKELFKLLFKAASLVLIEAADNILQNFPVVSHTFSDQYYNTLSSDAC